MQFAFIIELSYLPPRLIAQVRRRVDTYGMYPRFYVALRHIFNTCLIWDNYLLIIPCSALQFSALRIYKLSQVLSCCLEALCERQKMGSELGMASVVASFAYPRNPGLTCALVHMCFFFSSFFFSFFSTENKRNLLLRDNLPYSRHDSTFRNNQ